MPIVKWIKAVPEREVTEFVFSLRKHEDADFNDPRESVGEARGSVSRFDDLVCRSSTAESGTPYLAVPA